MKRSTKINLGLISILTIFSFASPSFSAPYDDFFGWLLACSFFVCSLIWVTSAIRNKSFRLFHPNPVDQVKAASSTSLNKIEKTILIYAVFILVGCLLGIIFYPVIDAFKQI